MHPVEITKNKELHYSVTVKYWAFVASGEIGMAFPECCSPLNGWNDSMIYKEALRGSDEQTKAWIERRSLEKLCK